MQRARGRPCAVVVGSGFAVSDASKATVLDVLRLTQAPCLSMAAGLRRLQPTRALPRCASASLRGFLRLLPRIGARPTAFLQHSILKKSRHRALVAKRKASRRRRLTHCLLQGAFGVICVLKGPDTYIADGNEESADDVLVLTCGTPALAKAGTGDVLAGSIGSLLARGMEPKDACALGAFVHARAGVLAAADSAELCVTTEDVLAHLPHAIRALDRKL